MCSHTAGRKQGKDYLNKYIKFKEKFDISKDFMEYDLYSNFLNEYHNIITKLKGILQTLKNNKMSNKYPDFTNLYFIDNHIKIIDELFDRLNRYMSYDIFRSYYLPKIQDYSWNESKEVESIKSYIENK